MLLRFFFLLKIYLKLSSLLSVSLDSSVTTLSGSVSVEGESLRAFSLLFFCFSACSLT